MDLLKECLRDFWAPNSKTLISSRPVSYGRVLIYQIAVCIMLHHISRGVPPVIKNLASEDVSADTPHAFIAFACQPVVAELLCIEVVDFE